MKRKTASILPESIYAKELLLSSAIGAGIGATTNWLLNRRKNGRTQLNKALLGALYGGLAGAGTNVAWQKLKEQLGGRYVGRRQSLPDLTKHKEVNVHVHGADYGPLTFRENREKHDNTAFFGWDEKEDAIKYINSLPKDVKVNLSGYSYGGDSAYDIAATVKDRLNSVRLLAPTGLRGFTGSMFGLPIKAPYRGAKNYTVEFAGNVGERSNAQKRSNLWAALGGEYDARSVAAPKKIIHLNDSHKLESAEDMLY